MITVKRTTLRLQEPLYRQLKKLAVDAHRDLQDVVNEAIALYIPTLEREVRAHPKVKETFGSYNLGYKGGSRRDIYEDL